MYNVFWNLGPETERIKFGQVSGHSLAMPNRASLLKDQFPLRIPY